MALHLEMFVVSGAKALIVDIHRNQGGSTGSAVRVNRIDPCDDSSERGTKNVRSRTIVSGFVLIVALALVAGSVLLIAYVAAAASLLTVLTLLVKRAIRSESIAPTESFVSRWIDADHREAA